MLFGDENNLKAFRSKAYRSCRGFVGSEFKQDYFFKEGLVCANGFFFRLHRTLSSLRVLQPGLVVLPGRGEWELDGQPRGAGLGAPNAV